MNYIYESTKIISLGSCAFRQPYATSHCRYLHGYRLQAKFWFGCNYLDNNNWVVDFGGLKDLKQELEKQFDHTTCVWVKDPEINTFLDLNKKGIIDLRIMQDGVGIEKFAEFCLKLGNDIIASKTNNRCFVTKVEVWEHNDNSAIAINNVTSTNKVEDDTVKVTEQPKVEVESVVNETVSQETVQPPQPEKLNCPPLHYPKSSNSFKDLFKGTSWGN